MELFKERLMDSLVGVILVLVVVAVIMGLCDIYWPLAVLGVLLVITIFTKWIHWLFIEPFAKEKQKKLLDK